jgi:hypothetical protein
VRTLLRGALLTSLVLSVGLNTGCETDDDDATSIEDCPDGLLFTSPPPPDGCGETYCGAPIVRVGTGITAYEDVEEEQEVPIWYGSQGGYHLDITVEMMNLCPIVFLRPYFLMDLGGEEPVEVFTQNRHVQAVRVEPDVSPRQQFWGIRGFIPCEHWPNDPLHDLDCPEGRGSEGFLEQYDAIIGVEVWDHNLGPNGEEQYRYGEDSRRVDPYCCGGDE